MAAVVEIEVSAAAATRALSDAGFEPDIRDAAGTIRVRLPGDDAYAQISTHPLVPWDKPGAWREAHRHDADTVLGYVVGFHEGGSRVTREHTVFTDDVVDTVREWSRWEDTWSVTPLPPRGPRHRPLAASKLSSAAISVTVDIDPLLMSLLDRSQAAELHRVIEELFLPGLRWRFPRGKTGSKLETKTQVLLHECLPPKHPSVTGLWLVADGPVPRGDQVLTVRLAHAVGRAAWHRWDSTPEYWRTGPRTLDELWGTGTDEITDLLLAGQIGQALDACGVAVDRGTERLLSGLPDSFDLREWTDKWVTNTVDLLATAAPWRWNNVVPARQRPRRIGNLGGFNPNRRPGLFLQDGPLLTFRQSASPLVAPRVTWQRDIDQDLVRLGLLTRDQIPMPPA